jgi:hypothetical protein
MLSRVDTNLFFLSFFFIFFLILSLCTRFLGIEFYDCFQLDKYSFRSGCYNHFFFYKKIVHLFLFTFLLYN